MPIPPASYPYPGYPGGYPPYPTYYSPYPSDLEMEFSRPRRRAREEKEAPKEIKPKTLTQHIKEWLAGK